MLCAAGEPSLLYQEKMQGLEAMLHLSPAGERAKILSAWDPEALWKSRGKLACPAWPRAGETGSHLSASSFLLCVG